MIAITEAEIKDNFEAYCDRVAKDKETIIVTRKDNKNVVVISESEYNAMLKAARNADYLAMIDKSMSVLEQGGLMTRTIDELRDLE